MDLGPCPDENALLDFAGGLLDSSELARLEEHIGRCPSCQVILGRWLQSEGSDPEAREAPVTGHRTGALLDTPEMARGAALDRYVLLKPLGAGGMGLVFAAYDPLLDRTVAIKVLRHEVATAMPSSVRVRMLREARAMARLSHPNVVAVHDAGLFHGRVFIAMEYLEGGSLADWLRARPRTWKEIRDVFVNAGRGLAAAHARGLVHRDFKPQNVLFGADGAVKISDFGLVRPTGSVAEAPAAVEMDPVVALNTPAGEKLVTATGAVVGTPGYIAPEQMRGAAPDGRSDQYSFCAALHLALHGHLPMVAGGQAAAIPFPDWLGRLVAKGLEVSPEARYPSMETLLDELSSRDRRIRRRTVWAAVASVALVASGGTVVLGLRPPTQCRDHAERLSRAWGPERKSAVQAAFARSPVVVARESWEHLERALNQYAELWDDQYAHACQAAHSTPQSSRALGPIADCLDGRLDELDTLTSTLTAANDFMVREEAIRVVSKLPAPAACLGAARSSSEPELASGKAQTSSRDVLGKLDQATALYRAGEYARAVSIVEPLMSEVRALRYPPAEARTLALMGKLRARTNHHKEAAIALRQGMLAAIRAGQPALACELSAEVAESLADQGEFEVADEYVDLGDALRPDGTPAVEARILEGRAAILALKGNWKESGQLLEHALLLTREAYGDRHPQTAAVLLGLAGELLAGPDLERAQQLAREGHDIYEAIYGPNHPDTLSALRKMAQTARNRSDYRTERTLAERVLRTELSLSGPDTVQVATARWYLASALVNLGEIRAALDQFHAAQVTYERNYAGSGEKDRQLAALYGNIGSCHLGLGEDGEARAAFQRALDTHSRSRGADDPKMAGYLADMGAVVASEGRLSEADLFFQRAIATAQAAGRDNRDLQFPHLAAAAAQYEAGHFKRAQESYLAALPYVQEGGTTDSVELAQLEVGLAAAELAQGQVETAGARAISALATMERVVGVDQPLSAAALTAAGEAQRRLGQVDLAIRYLERAERLRRQYGARPIERGETFLALALALRAQGKSPERSQALMREARAELSKSAWREVWLARVETFTAR